MYDSGHTELSRGVFEQFLACPLGSDVAVGPIDWGRVEVVYSAAGEKMDGHMPTTCQRYERLRGNDVGFTEHVVSIPKRAIGTTVNDKVG